MPRPASLGLRAIHSTVVEPQTFPHRQRERSRDRIRRGSPRREAQYGALRDVEAEHFEFAMNARRAPGGILGDHPEDKSAQFFARWSSSSANTMPRDPFPVQFESLAMPANNRLGLHDEECLFPSGPESSQHHPKQPIRRGTARLRMLGTHDSKLLPQGQVLQKQFAT